MTDLAAAVPPTRGAQYAGLGMLPGLAVTAVAGAALYAAGLASAVGLLVAIGCVQALLAAAWVFGTGMPGRWGGMIIGAAAGAGADITVSVWPHDKLGTMLPVLGLAVPAMFVHQLARGAARVQLVSSLSAIALLVAAEIALPALLQLRHEFVRPDNGGKVVAGVVLALGGALVVGYLVDFVVSSPRFDADVPRGLPALVASAAMGAAMAYLILKDQTAFAHGRATFVGAALGALAGLLAVAAAFVLHTTPAPVARISRALRPAVGALLPLCLLAPAAFLICLAVRT